MNDALEKSLILFGLIALGFILKSKIKNGDQINGIKELVLTVALPSMIFIALMNIELDSTMLLVPALTLVFNFLIYFITPTILSIFGLKRETAMGRTLIMLMPSLAPGLSCFPFIAEFLGDKSVAIGALADVGNKFFVLIFLYIIALNMFLKNTKSEEQKLSSKIKSLLITLVKEPINIIILGAIILLSFGLKYSDLPKVLTGILDKTSVMMTPLVLIYIGLAVQLKKGMKRVVLSMLVFRSAVSLILSTLAIILMGISDPIMALIILVIPQSSVSFWPLAHISLFNSKEVNMEIPIKSRTFDIEQAILVLAFSLPLSTLIILSILSSGELFLNPYLSLGYGAFLIIMVVAINLYPKLGNLKMRKHATN